MYAGVLDEVMVPASGPERERTLASYLASEKFVPMITHRRIESLLVIPLVARGRPIGVLVLGRDRGRRFTGSHPFLNELGERIAQALDTLLALSESRRVAQLLTQSLVPLDLPEVPGLATASYFQPAHQAAGVGGDFYAIHGPPDDVTVTCGDVAGKGILAAIMAKRLSNAISTGSQVDRDPAWLLGLVNTSGLGGDRGTLRADLHDGLPAAAPRRRGSITADVASAGHTPPLLLRADGTLENWTWKEWPSAWLPAATYAAVQVELGVSAALLPTPTG